MSVTFKNAPLVELVAELRWIGTAPTAQPNMPVMMQGVGSDLDQFLMRIGGELYSHGFHRTERLVPPGFPIFPFQPVLRLRKDGDVENSVLFHAGLGLFSVHAVPPYRSWEKVSVFVRTGLEALLKARSPDDHEKPFIGASLRYINAFGPKLTGDNSIASFVEDVLGFSIQLPSGMSRHIKPGGKPKPHVQLSFPLEGDAYMAAVIGEGIVNDEQSIIMDMTVSYPNPLPADLEAVMTAFTNARNVIHSIFVSLTKPIEDLLEPVEEQADAA